MQRRTSRFISALVAAALLPLAACGDRTPAATGSPPQVGIVTLRPEPIAIADDLPGRTSAVRVAQVRARVDGVVLRREFTEGSDVRAGQRLYKIDPAPYAAAVASAAAALARAEAAAAAAELGAERSAALLAAHATSRQDHETATAARLQARADVAAARAALQAARIDLEYTDVVAPIAGRIGKSMVTEGAYVRQSEATLLATVQQLDSIYVDVTQSSMELLRLRREFERGNLQRAEIDGARVALVLEDGSIYPETGSLQFAEASVDPGTGTVALRAQFPNPRGELLPGMFVHARVETAVDRDALLVPQQGVTYDLKGQPTALVVGADNKVELRTLQISRAIGNRWLLAGGLQPGDRVIVEGVQKARPGIEVQAVAATDPAAGNPVATSAD